MDEESKTSSTPFIVGMVFFAIGVILIVVLIIVVMYCCIYRRRKKKFEKKRYLTMDNSIVYTKSPPSLDLRPPSISKEVTGNGNIQSMTTMSPLDSPDTVYAIENGPAQDNVLHSASVPQLHHNQSFDSVDHADRKLYVLQQVHPAYGTAKRKKGRRKTKVRKAYSTAYSLNRRDAGSLYGTKKHKVRTAKSERGYHMGHTNTGFYHHADTLPSRKSHKVYGSTPTLVRLEPLSVASMPQHSPTAASSQRLYTLSHNNRPVSTSQSLVMSSQSPPRSPRSPRFAVAHSLDGFNNFDEDHHHHYHTSGSRSKSHNTSRDYSTSHDLSTMRNNSTDGNHLRWSPSMKSKLTPHDKVGDKMSRSNSDLTSISRSGRKKGIQEHKYIYDPKYGTLEQF